MKRSLALFLAIIVTVICSSCASSSKNEPLNIEPQIAQVKAICELAVMDCYYHNVAKFTEEDAQGILWFKKDKHFWIEYSGIVTLGIDVSLVNVEIADTQVTITLPDAKVLSCKVDSASLTEDSFIVDKSSADIEASDEVTAFKAAQDRLEETVSNDKALLASARQSAQNLLEEYVTNIGNLVGREYSIKWIYTDSNGKQGSMSTSEPERAPTSEIIDSYQSGSIR